MYTYTDYFDLYGRIMQFNKNKFEPIHRWYPFVEGYSKEFIQSIIKELVKKPDLCIEPFSGSGTTALELQDMDILCSSFEVNPFMYLIARIKLEIGYDVKELIECWNIIKNARSKVIITELRSEFQTLYEKEGLKKWNYHKEVAISVNKLISSIKTLENDTYVELFTVTLASILLDVSNLYRNGKCLSYKKGWQERRLSELEVYERFDSKVQMQIEDIEKRSINGIINNKSTLYNMDSRIGIDRYVQDESADLVITSPPYLNSRDYTDTYMLELKTLGFTSTLKAIRELREKTLRSHVQIKWDDIDNINNPELNVTLEKLNFAVAEKGAWNDSIIDMVRLYFVDIKHIFNVLYRKLKARGRVYFNVSNSAYFNVLINILEICALIAEEEGFKVIEIRKARILKTSPQQKAVIGNLLEGVIVLEK